MSLLDANGYEAVFGTPEGDSYRMPLVCWREEGDQLYGVVLVKGHLRRAEQLHTFLRYDARNPAGPAEAPSADTFAPAHTPAVR